MHPCTRKEGGIGVEMLALEWVASLPCPPPRRWADARTAAGESRNTGGRHVIFTKQWASEKEELRASSLLVDAQCLGLFETLWVSIMESQILRVL